MRALLYFTAATKKKKKKNHSLKTYQSKYHIHINIVFPSRRFLNPQRVFFERRLSEINKCFAQHPN